jgi:hypothetical protein
MFFFYECFILYAFISDINWKRLKLHEFPQFGDIIFDLSFDVAVLWGPVTDKSFDFIFLILLQHQIYNLLNVFIAILEGSQKLFFVPVKFSEAFII